ncbi:hypothetical protein [Streptomyces sp. NPDC088725]|uniref:hypothetical protein n=1 Tax=Streptomyces sp. NPDC088725 TaxID=3365873 RepID=UPI0038150BB3
MRRIWDQAGWPRETAVGRDTTVVASTGRRASGTRWLAGGRATGPRRGEANTYSVDPAPTLSDAVNPSWVTTHARIQAYFTGPTEHTVDHAQLQDARGHRVGGPFTCARKTAAPRAQAPAAPDAEARRG